MANFLIDKYWTGEFEDPSFHVFQWAILQNKKKLAFLYWEQTRVCNNSQIF